MSQGMTVLIACGMLPGTLMFLQWRLKVERDRRDEARDE